jgi:hypothetical protein
MSLQLNGDTGVTFNDASLQGAAASPYVLKNRIINGDMVIDQRNAGASVTPIADTYLVDRWLVGLTSSTTFFSWQQSSTAPTGFTKSLLATSLGANTPSAGQIYSLIQKIEGFNTADLGWGTASAQTVTLSFWVRASVTGTYAVIIGNSGLTRVYPATYTINSANTWEQKTITIAGDTSGTWETTNGTGIRVNFNLGTGSTYAIASGSGWVTSTGAYTVSGTTNISATNGATFYITGVQLEQNTTATPFERRLYNQELTNCQRYYWKMSSESSYGANVSWFFNTFSYTTTIQIGVVQNPVQMRTTPTLTTSGTASHYRILQGNTTIACSSVPVFDQTNILNNDILLTVASGLTIGYAGMCGANSTTLAFLGFNAEL